MEEGTSVRRLPQSESERRLYSLPIGVRSADSASARAFLSSVNDSRVEIWPIETMSSVSCARVLMSSSDLNLSSSMGFSSDTLASLFDPLVALVAFLTRFSRFRGASGSRKSSFRAPPTGSSSSPVAERSERAVVISQELDPASPHSERLRNLSVDWRCVRAIAIAFAPTGPRHSLFSRFRSVRFRFGVTSAPITAPESSRSRLPFMLRCAATRISLKMRSEPGPSRIIFSRRLLRSTARVSAWMPSELVWILLPDRSISVIEVFVESAISSALAPSASMPQPRMETTLSDVLCLSTPKRTREVATESLREMSSRCVAPSSISKRSQRIWPSRHLMMGAIRARQRPSVAISGHQWSSVVISGHQWSSEAIRGDQRPSEAVRGHQRPSGAIRGHPRTCSRRSAGSRQCR